MKTTSQHLICALGIALLATPLNAQTDSLRYTQEAGKLEPQRFIDAYDYVFMTKEPSKWILKAGVTGIYGRSDLNSLGGTGLIGGEFKLSPSFSAGANLVISGYDYVPHGIGYEGYSRWYYNMSKRIRAGKSANNFSGNYVGLSYQNKANYLESLFRSDKLVATKVKKMALSYGLQRRFFQHGWADFQVSLMNSNINYYRDTEMKYYGFTSNGLVQEPLFFNIFSLSTNWQVGLAIGDIKPKQSKIQTCDVFRCLDEQKKWFKLLMPVLNLTLGHQNITLGGVYERRIRQLPLSLNFEEKVTLNTYRIRDVNSTSSSYNLGYQVVNWNNVELRYYIAKKRDIEHGKTALNFSGSYLGINQGVCFAFSDYNSQQIFFQVRDKWYNVNFWAALVVGYQKRLFKNGFIDARIGLPIPFITKDETTISPMVQRNITDLKLGFAF